MEQSFYSISVCIPVYNSEPVLRRAIDSVLSQDFESFEVIIVNDGSKNKDEKGLDCKKIVKLAQKENKLLRKKLKLPAIRIKYIEHRKNLGLLEARRTAIENAQGEYICNLDSDDVLLPGALKTLYSAATKTNADIVQGKTEYSSAETLSEMHKRYNNVYIGQLESKDIFDSWLVKQTHTGILWAKLIRRETYLKALSYIPFTRCVMIEDFLQYFFIAQEAKKYTGIEDKVYRYSIDTGISSAQKITDLTRWEQICTASNVFTIIFSAIEENEVSLSFEQLEALRLQSRSYLVNNIGMLKHNVIPELQMPARQLLCEYWGSDFVETMEKALEESNNKL